MEMDRSAEAKRTFTNFNEVNILERELWGKEDFLKILEDVIQCNFLFTNPLLAKKIRNVLKT